MNSRTLHINPQDRLIESLEGIHLVDAGAGTGKTYAIIKRYQKMIDSGIKPEEILLITFTKNAAEQMKKEVIGNISGDISMTDLLEAPVMNFHSMCARILKSSGSHAPEYLGSKELLPGNFSILEDFALEPELFRKFYHSFEKENLKKYEKIFQSLNDDTRCVLQIIKKLCTVGIFPMRNGWFNKSDDLLGGSFEKYSEKFDKLNEPVAAVRGGEKQNLFVGIIKDISDKLYIDFEFENMIEGKRANENIKENVFHDEHKEGISEFVREIYFAYIEHLLKKNYLTFEFVIMFAFLLLFKDEQIMKKNQYSFVMVDEFQDTDEIQFLLLMMLVKDVDGQANFCVVGDWRQGIYGFRNTTIENITGFSERLKEYKLILNADRKRITYDVNEVEKISFEYNYRSSQKILDFSLQTLRCNASQKEETDFSEIERNFPKALDAKRKLDDMTEIKFYQTKEEKAGSEVEIILQKISELVDGNYMVREFHKDGKKKCERKICYSDICVLSRTKIFGLRLQRAGLEKGIPINYEGGLELFASQQAILVLAWLRVMLNQSSPEGWMPILEKEGYTFNEVYCIIKNETLFNLIPENLLNFRKQLLKKSSKITFIVSAILDRYNFNDEFASAVISEIANFTKTDFLSIGDLVNLISESVNDPYNIEINKSANAVVTQTIHLAKGLEYPVVIIANVNRNVFPNTTNITSNIFFHPVTGLRMRKQFHFTGKYHYIFSNWRSEMLIKMFRPENYDEERRLLYVAATRAKQYLYFTAYRPSQFFEKLAEKTGNSIIKDFEYKIKSVTDENKFISEKINPPVISKVKRNFKSVHKLMDDAEGIVIEKITSDDSSAALKPKENALEYGVKIHQIAYKLANGFKSDSGIEEVKRISDFISGLKANELRPEVDFLFPKGDEIIRGTIDLLAFYDDRIEIIDYKTDNNKAYLEKYKVQISIYRELIESINKGKKVVCKLFFVSLNEIIDV